MAQTIKEQTVYSLLIFYIASFWGSQESMTKKWKADLKGAELVSLSLELQALSYPSNHPSINLSFLLSTHLFIHPSIYVSIHLLIHLSSKHCLRVSSVLSAEFGMVNRDWSSSTSTRPRLEGPMFGRNMMVETLLRCWVAGAAGFL